MVANLCQIVILACIIFYSAIFSVEVVTNIFSFSMNHFGSYTDILTLLIGVLYNLTVVIHYILVMTYTSYLVSVLYYGLVVHLGC